MARQTDTLLNASQGARHLGISRPTFNKAVEKGILSAAASGKSGKKFDPDRLEREWGDYAEYSALQSRHHEGASRGGRPPKNGPAPKPASVNEVDAKLRGKSTAQKLTEAKTLAAVYQAKKLKLELDQLEGSLVSIDEVKKSGAELGATLLGAFASLPSRVAPLVAAAGDVGEVSRILEREIDGLMADVRAACGIEDEG